jgi:hypothetical protein
MNSSINVVIRANIFMISNKNALKKIAYFTLLYALCSILKQEKINIHQKSKPD